MFIPTILRALKSFLGLPKFKIKINEKEDF